MKNTLRRSVVCLESSGPEVATNEPLALEHSEAVEEPRTMSHLGHYTDSASANNLEHHKNTWRSIGEIIAREIAPDVARLVREKQAEGRK